MKTEPTSVLLIDDDVALLEMIKLMSERSREMTIHTAQSAKEALGTLEQKSFDVIFKNSQETRGHNTDYRIHRSRRGIRCDRGIE